MKKTFSERVLDIALSIKEGEISTYGDIARAAGGGAQSARSITGILGNYAHKGVQSIPFHRIVYAGGRIWQDPLYNKERERLYTKESIHVDTKGYIINFEKHRKQF
jgi:alkylated DNA nucleotide flippase Atl1